MIPIKRKFNSALLRLKQAAIGGYRATVKLLVETLTEKYWLVDYLPTFTRRKEGLLLVRLDLIGDFVLWLDAAQAYQRLYPNEKITLVVNSASAELARALPHWDEVIGVNVHRLREDMVYRLRTFIQLRWRNFAIVIQPTFSREFVGDLVLRSTNAPARIGYRGDTNNISEAQKTKSDLWYSKLIIGDPACTMELRINAQFVRELGQKDFVGDVPFIPKIETPLLNSVPAKPYVVIAPGASWQSKMWPLDEFAALILQLNSIFNLHFVLCGDKNDRTLCESLANKVNLDNLTNIAGQTNLIQLIEIIRGAILVVSNDSSPVHLAAATRTRAVCILGGGHFGRFLPYQVERSTLSRLPVSLWSEMDCFGCSWRCKFAPQDGNVVPCISNVALQEVIRSCRALLVS